MNANPTDPDRPTEIEATRLMQRCPRFQRCGAPACPLDLHADRRVVLPTDPVCGLPRAKRLALAAGTPLPHVGLTPQEWKRQQAWAKLPEEERARRKARLERFRFVSPRVSGPAASTEADSTSSKR